MAFRLTKQELKVARNTLFYAVSPITSNANKLTLVFNYVMEIKQERKKED